MSSDAVDGVTADASASTSLLSDGGRATTPPPLVTVSQAFEHHKARQTLSFVWGVTTVVCILIAFIAALYVSTAYFPSLTKSEVEMLAVPPMPASSTSFGASASTLVSSLGGAASAGEMATALSAFLSDTVAQPLRAYYEWCSALVQWLATAGRDGRIKQVLSEYMSTSLPAIVINYVLFYVFLQTFAIPGSLGLSFVGGSLFGFYWGLLLVCLCSAIGASGCYILSFLLGDSVVRRYVPATSLASYRAQVAARRDRLFTYMLALRVSPVPNFSINISAPHLGVPLPTFFFGTLFGVVPLSLIPVQTGAAIYEPSWEKLIGLGVMGVLAIAGPIVVQKVTRIKV